MNTGHSNKSQNNMYYPILNDTSISQNALQAQNNTPKKFSQPKNIQNHSNCKPISNQEIHPKRHQNQPIHSQIQHNQLNHPSKSLKQPQFVVNHNQYQNGSLSQNISYKQSQQSYPQAQNFKSNPKLAVIVNGSSKFSSIKDQKDSILYGQSVPCQKCGLISDGKLSLHNRRTVGAWASCLFLTTGMLCFLPCLMDRCKDTWIECPRCNHKKAVIKSQYCR